MKDAGTDAAIPYSPAGEEEEGCALFGSGPRPPAGEEEEDCALSTCSASNILSGSIRLYGVHCGE